MADLILKPGKERSIRLHHPWVFSGAIGEVRGDAEAGSTVRILDAGGRPIAWAAYSPESQIRARVWSFDIEEEIDPSFFARRIHMSVQNRKDLWTSTNAGRIVFSESDQLPGVTVDRYADMLVVQLLTAGARKWRDAIVHGLVESMQPKGIYEKSDSDALVHEGLKPATGLLYGTMDEPVLIEERMAEATARFQVNIEKGQKTGFYLDQRSSRSRLAQIAQDQNVLNLFCYTASFAVAAHKGRARSVRNVDSSQEALRLAKENVRINGFECAETDFVQADIPIYLRTLVERGESFDLIVLDPPKFVHSRTRMERALSGYKDLNRLALGLVRPGGLLLTYSCSGLVSEELFQKVVFGASMDAKRNVQILERLGQPLDHPVLLSFPEAQYLKGFLCRVL